jgi:DNA mismatch endonuclease, patch repair protein
MKATHLKSNRDLKKSKRPEALDESAFALSSTAGRNQRPNRTPAKVSARMRAVRQRHTKPELAVRHIVRLLGVRYRVCCSTLPGRPDLSNQTRRWCIFVNGCFWHGHDCVRGRLPKINQNFWRPKIELNRARDAKVQKELHARGYRVLTVWQCGLVEPSRLRARLARFLQLPIKKVNRRWP